MKDIIFILIGIIITLLAVIMIYDARKIATNMFSSNETNETTITGPAAGGTDGAHAFSRRCPCSHGHGIRHKLYHQHQPLDRPHQYQRQQLHVQAASGGWKVGLLCGLRLFL